MACVDVRCPEDYEAVKDDVAACLHFIAGQYAEIECAAHIDSIMGQAQAGRVSGTTRIGTVRGSAAIDVLSGNAEIGAVCDSARLGYIIDAASVGEMTDRSGVGCVRDRGRIGQVADCAIVGSMAGGASVESVRDSARIGIMRDSSRVSYIGSSATIGSVLGSARVDFAAGIVRIGYVGDRAEITAADFVVIHAYGGVISAAQQVIVYQHHPDALIAGGRIVRVSESMAMTVADWANLSGTVLLDGSLVVFSAVDADLVSDCGISYSVGANVIADERTRVSGRNPALHFFRRPLASVGCVAPGPRRYLACLVRAADIIIIDNERIEAPTCQVLYEVDALGNRLTGSIRLLNHEGSSRCINSTLKNCQSSTTSPVYIARTTTSSR